jgi:hypothetical protein
MNRIWFKGRKNASFEFLVGIVVLVGVWGFWCRGRVDSSEADH